MELKFNFKKVLVILFFLGTIFSIGSSFGLTQVHATYIAPTAARMWYHSGPCCYNQPGGWQAGGGITGANYIVGDTMAFQCFQNMSSPQGWLDHAFFELWWPDGNYTNILRNDDTNSYQWNQYLYASGQYHFRCSRYGDVAEDQYFTMFPNTLGCNQSCSPYSGFACAAGTYCYYSTAAPYVGYFCRGTNNPYSASCANQSKCNEQCNPGATKPNPTSCTGAAGNNDCYYDGGVGGYRCRSSFNYASTTCPVCTPVKPNNSVVQVVPTNGQTGVVPFSGSYVSLQWYDQGSSTWGQGCPSTIASYHLYVNKGCVAGGYVDLGQTTLLQNALAGTKYCWFVRKDNGSVFQDTATWSFTTATCAIVNVSPGTLISPPDNAQVTLGPGNSVPVSYDAASMSWGQGCPSSIDTVHVMVQPNCLNAWTDYGNVTTISGLSPGTLYCWRIDRSYGLHTAQSCGRRFTTIDDGSTVSAGSGITTADVCGNGYSGQTDPTRANPLNVSVNFSTAAGNTYREVWLAFVPSTGAYADNNDTEPDSIINGKVANSQSIGVKIDLVNNKVNTINASGSWDGGTGSGDLTNSSGTAKVLGFGSATTASAVGVNITSNFQIQFNDTFPYNIPNNDKYNLYVAVVIKNSLGTIKSSYSDPVNSFVYKKINATGSRTSWGVDTKKPTITMSGPTFSGGTTFSIGWGASDLNTSVPLGLNSYITTDTAGSALSDNTYGAISMIVAPPDPAPPIASNGKITTANLGTHNYTITNPAVQSGFGFILYAKDGSCNSANSSITAANQKPWLISYNGDISANGGIPGISVPNIPNYQMPFTTDNNAGFFSTYSALSGNIDLPIKKPSKLQEYSTKLQNSAALPPQDTGFANWYDYLLDSVTKNNATPFIAPPATNTITGTVATWEGLVAGGGGGVGGGVGGSSTYLLMTSDVQSWGSVGPSIAQDSTGADILIGTLKVGGQAIIKLKPDGTFAWTKTIGAGKFAYNLIKTSDGNFLISIGADLVKFDTNGNILLDYKLSSPTITNVIQTSDGGYAVVLIVNSGYANLVKLNSNFTIAWEKHIAPPANEYLYVTALMQASDGGYVIGAGVQNNNVANSPPAQDYWYYQVTKLNSIGNLVWSKQVDVLNINQAPVDIVEASDGGYLVGGTRFQIIGT